MANVLLCVGNVMTQFYAHAELRMRRLNNAVMLLQALIDV
jgi:hypothetical protein